MSSGLVLILIVVAAYLSAHVVLDWLARRYFVVSGAEYLLLGVLLGPQVSDVITASTVDRFAPFLTLAFGWIGALVGVQFFVPELLRLPAAAFRAAFAEATITLVVIGGVMAATLMWWFGLPRASVIEPAVALGAIGVASAPAGIALVARTLRDRVPVVRQLQITTGVDAVVAILAFGLLLSITRVEGAPRPTATEWTVIAVGIGFVGGALFHLFLGSEKNIDRLFIALAGALILSSGAAAYLRLSPLLPTMLIGMVLVNTSATRTEIRDVLARVERPLYFVLLVFAGAAWQPGGAWIVPAVVFLLLRPFAKVGAARLSARAAGILPAVGSGWGLGLLGHGGLALAIALNYRLYDDSPLAHVIFTTTIVSLLLTDLFSARVVKALVSSYRSRMQAATAEAEPTEGSAS